ncbi:MAG: energy transducer TonB [Immundisolibacter sp.]|uniref:energy transducer TonB n=1 Tax=Immundisolibacter sp. TaxID=1934948 RepID=UPI00198D23C1|nr:energy transducer TonB [Immundisolibacter sp.]MBC7162083.1 energy transducer TonB [Immundisolibacter sp.]
MTDRVGRAQPVHEGIAGAGCAVVLHALAAFLLLRQVPTLPLTPPQIIQMSLIAEPQPEPRPAPQSPAPQPAAAQAAKAPPIPSPQPRPQRRPAPRPVAAKPMPLAPAPTQSVPSAPAPTVVSASISDAPAVAAPAATTAPVEVTQPRFDAAYLNNPAPPYPPLSRRLGEQGRVLMRVYVDPNGTPTQVELRQSSGSQRLDTAAQTAVRRWRFVPARRGSEAVGAWVLVPISFNLRNS